MMFSSILNTQNTTDFRCKNAGLRLGRELSRKHGLLPLWDRYDSASHFCSVREHLAGTCPYRPVVPSGESKRDDGHCHPFTRWIEVHSSFSLAAFAGSPPRSGWAAAAVRFQAALTVT